MSNPVIVEVRLTGQDGTGALTGGGTPSAPPTAPQPTAPAQQPPPPARPFGGPAPSQPFSGSGSPPARPLGGTDTIAPPAAPSPYRGADTPSPSSAPTRVMRTPTAAQRQQVGPGQPAKEFDPTEAALNRMQREGERDSTDAAYRQLRGLPSAADESAANLQAKHQKAADRLAEQQRKQQERAEARQFDPARAAQQRIEREGQRAQADATYRQMQGLPSAAQESAAKQRSAAAKLQERNLKATATQQRGRLQTIGRALNSFGQAGIANAVGSKAGAALSTAGGIAELATLGGVGGPVAIVTKALVELGKAAVTLVHGFVERGRELAAYSPILAGTNAVVGVRGLQADIKEANVLGPGIAKLTDQESQLATMMRDIMLPVKDGIVGSLIPFTQVAVDLLKPMAEFANKYGPDIAVILKSMAASMAPQPGLLKGLLEGIGWIRRNEEEKKDINKNYLWEEFLKLENFGAQGGQLRGGDPVQRAAKHRLNIPAFGHMP